jgi:hypothetical protein
MASLSIIRKGERGPEVVIWYWRRVFFSPLQTQIFSKIHIGNQKHMKFVLGIQRIEVSNNL